MRKTIIMALFGALGTLTATESKAAFVFEGLQPFSVRACDPSPGAALREPRVADPGEGLVLGTPSRFNDGGKDRFRIQPCQVAPRGKRPTHPARDPSWRTK